MMSRFALAFSVLLFGMVTIHPDGDVLCAQEEQAQPDKPEAPQPKPGEEKADPAKPDAVEQKPKSAEGEQPKPEVPTPKQDPDEKTPGPDLSGFDRIDAYQLKWGRLNQFLGKVEDEITDATPNLDDRPSPVVDETMRLMRVLDLSMLREARQIYEQALSSEDPETRNRLLRRLVKLETITPLSDITTRAENLLNALTVNGTTYNTLEEAREAKRKIRQAEENQIEGISKKYQSELNKLKQEQLNESLIEAEKRLKEEDARKVLKTAVRLVVPQRRERLKHLLQKYSNTRAATEAQAILTAIDQRDEIIARRKLREALCAPVVFDQRWRRLKELIREYSRTTAATEAEQIFFQRALQVPSMTIANHTMNEVDITVDVPYEKATLAELSPGEMQSFSSVFPMMVRVKVGENEWDVYQALAGLHYVLQIRHDQKPILYPAPKAKPLPAMPPAPVIAPTPVLPSTPMLPPASAMP